MVHPSQIGFANIPLQAGKFLIAFSIVFMCLCTSLTLSRADAADATNEPLARWHINYANYLIDVGKYLQGLENFDTALELSSLPKTQGDALLGKAMLLAAFLDAPDEALKVYDLLQKRYPDRAETAIYRKAMLLIELDRYGDAKRILHAYLRDYPKGRFNVQVEALIRALEHPIPAKPTEIIGIPELRVRLFRRAKRVGITGASEQSPVCCTDLGCNSRFVVVAQGNHLLVNDKKLSKKQMSFYSSKPLSVSSGIKSKKVRGSIRMIAHNGSLLTINLINIEDYLLSVVPAESIPTWPLEALKAQAVAARTYAFYQMLHRKNRTYDLVATQGDQVYGGVGLEQARTTRAVRDTQGLILTHRGHPILAMYTANSGGYTADAGAVFDLHKPYLIAHEDPVSLKGKMAYWERRYSVSRISEALNKIGIKGKSLRDILVAAVGPSGRVLRVKFVFQSGSKVMRTRTSLVRALNLPEILFKIRKQGDMFIFKGRGFGHGVGYSQWGSAFMAETKTFREILSFYYPASILVKKW